MSIIYGVNTEKEITAEMVRDALTDCFYEAHCAQSELGGADPSSTKLYCRQIVTKAFMETGGDIEHPTKSSLMATIPWLAEFSKSFRDQTTIQKHMQQIVELIGIVKE
jgi:hypothetical protein